MQVNYKEKKKTKLDKLLLLGKGIDTINKLDTIEVLISKAPFLIDSHTSHDEFVSANNVLREYNEIKEVIKSPQKPPLYTR